LAPQDITFLYDAPEFQEGASTMKKNSSNNGDNVSKFSRRKVNPVLKIMNYITNVKFNGKDRHSEKKNSAFRRMDDSVLNIDLNTKKIINYMDFVHTNKDLIKPRPVYPAKCLNVKRERGISTSEMDFSEYEPPAKRRKLESQPPMQAPTYHEITGLNKIRSAYKDDISMRSVNSILTKRQSSNIDMKSYHSKTLDQIQKEIFEKKAQNQKMLDEISERNSRRSLMLIDQESKIDHSEKRKIIQNYYKEKSRATMEELDLINDNYFSKRSKRGKFEQLETSKTSHTFEPKKQPGYIAPSEGRYEENKTNNNNIKVTTTNSEIIFKQPSFSDGRQMTFGAISSEGISDNKIADNILPKVTTTVIPTTNLNTKPIETAKSVETKTGNQNPLFGSLSGIGSASLTKPLGGTPSTGPLFGTATSTIKPPEGSSAAIFGLNKPDDKPVFTPSEVKQETKSNLFDSAPKVENKISFDANISDARIEAKPDNSLFGSKVDSVTVKPASSLFGSFNQTEEKKTDTAELPKFGSNLFKPDTIQQKTIEAKPLGSSIFSTDTKQDTKQAPIASETKLSDLFSNKEEPKSIITPKPEKEEPPKVEKKEEIKSSIFGFNASSASTLNTSSSLLSNTQPTFGFKGDDKKPVDTKQAVFSSYLAESGIKPLPQVEKKDEVKEKPNLPQLIPKEEPKIITTPITNSLMNNTNPFINAQGSSTNIFKSASPNTQSNIFFNYLDLSQPKFVPQQEIKPLPHQHNPFLSGIENKVTESNDMIISPVLSPTIRPVQTTTGPSSFNLNSNIRYNC
jgi:hypothetical protein